MWQDLRTTLLQNSLAQCQSLLKQSNTAGSLKYHASTVKIIPRRIESVHLKQITRLQILKHRLSSYSLYTGLCLLFTACETQRNVYCFKLLLVICYESNSGSHASKSTTAYSAHPAFVACSERASLCSCQTPFPLLLKHPAKLQKETSFIIFFKVQRCQHTLQ